MFFFRKTWWHHFIFIQSLGCFLLIWSVWKAFLVMKSLIIVSVLRISFFVYIDTHTRSAIIIDQDIEQKQESNGFEIGLFDKSNRIYKPIRRSKYTGFLLFSQLAFNFIHSRNNLGNLCHNKLETPIFNGVWALIFFITLAENIDKSINEMLINHSLSLFISQMCQNGYMLTPKQST